MQKRLSTPSHIFYVPWTAIARKKKGTLFWGLYCRSFVVVIVSLIELFWIVMKE